MRRRHSLAWALLLGCCAGFLALGLRPADATRRVCDADRAETDGAGHTHSPDHQHHGPHRHHDAPRESDGCPHHCLTCCLGHGPSPVVLCAAPAPAPVVGAPLVGTTGVAAVPDELPPQAPTHVPIA